MALIQCPDCGKSISDSAPACIGCGRPMTSNVYRPEEILPAEMLSKKADQSLLPGSDAFNEQALEQAAYKKAKLKDRLGVGCIIQAIGLLLGLVTFFTIIGPVIGLLLFIVGTKYAGEKIYFCNNCNNEVLEASTLCPGCRRRLVKDPKEAIVWQLSVAFLILSMLVLYESISTEIRHYKKSKTSLFSEPQTPTPPLSEAPINPFFTPKPGTINGYDESTKTTIDPINILRDYQNPDLGISGKVRHGEKVTILGETGATTPYGVKIKTSSGVTGWVSNWFVKED